MLQLHQTESSSWQVYSRLLGYTRRYWAMFVFGVLGFAVYASTQWMWAELVKYIVTAFEKGDTQAKNWIAFSIAGIFLVRGVGSFVGSYAISYVARQVVYRLRQQMFDHLLYFECRYFQNNAVGRLVAKITYNVDQVAAASTDALKTLFQEGFTVLGLMMYLFYTNWKLAILFFTVVPFIAFAVTHTSRRLRHTSNLIQQSMGDVAHVVTETLSAFETVKNYGGEQYEQQRFAKSSENNLKQSIKLVVTQSLNTPLVQFIVALALALIVWLALQPQFFGETTAGEFLAFITAAGMLAKPIRQLTQVNTALQRGIAGASSIFELLDCPLEPDSGQLKMSRVKGEVRFDAVSFAYPNGDLSALATSALPISTLSASTLLASTLSNINLTLHAGEHVALVGRSGAGKSTLAHLMLRFLLPTSGSIYLDDQPLADFQLVNLRQQIAIVSQRFHLFNDTVYKNIAYGQLQSCSEAQVWKAVEQASARHFIEALPQGIHTLVGENGVQLSGGQQQRIALARALLKDAPIVILDEATSALDPETEAAIQKALHEHLQGKTALIIAHRATTIEKADRIIVLDKGCVVEQGTHARLLAQQGLYASLYPSAL